MGDINDNAFIREVLRMQTERMRQQNELLANQNQLLTRQIELEDRRLALETQRLKIDEGMLHALGKLAVAIDGQEGRRSSPPSRVARAKKAQGA